MFHIVTRSVPVLFLILFGLSFQTASAQVTTTAASSTDIQNQQQVEKRVREYFADTPVMIEIARCESKFRQFTDSGSVLRGGAGGGMVGVFQFYEQIHAAPALALGFNVTTLEGNIGYARHLYTTSGTTPWLSAQTCWNVPVAPVSVAADTQVKIELLKQLLVLLQQLLVLKQMSV